MSDQGKGYGPAADVIGTFFWISAVAMFTSPVWVPVVAFVVGLIVSR